MLRTNSLDVKNFTIDQKTPNCLSQRKLEGKVLINTLKKVESNKIFGIITPLEFFTTDIVCFFQF